MPMPDEQKHVILFFYEGTDNKLPGLSSAPSQSNPRQRKTHIDRVESATP